TSTTAGTGSGCTPGPTRRAAGSSSCRAAGRRCPREARRSTTIPRMSDESPKDARGPRRAAQVAARGALWAPSRFFDPRFQGLHQHLDLAYHDLLAHFDDVVAHVDTVRDEAKAHREAVVYELKVLRDLL